MTALPKADTVCVLSRSNEVVQDDLLPFIFSQQGSRKPSVNTSFPQSRRNRILCPSLRLKGCAVEYLVSRCRVGISWGVFLLAVVALSACASTNHSVPATHAIKIGSIGIVSLLSDEFHLIHIGTTVLETRKQVDSVPQWKIDEFVTGLLKLSSTRGWQTIRKRKEH